MEFWLTRVLMHKGPVRRPRRVGDLNDAAQQTVMARIIGGELGTLPDGCIIEPVESFATEELAHAARLRKLVDEPDEDWRVIINVEVPAASGRGRR